MLMKRLRHQSAEEYSTIRVAKASSSKRTLSKVVRAQWLAAAARRHLRATSIVKREKSGNGAVQFNYEATYLRSAASLLTTTGKINLEAFWSSCVTRTIQSLENHLGEGDQSEQYAALVESLDMDPEAMCNSQSEAEIAIMSVTRVAESLDDSVDVNKVLSAFRTVCTWVESDLGGDHAMTPVSRRKIVPGLSMPATKLTVEEGSTSATERLVMVAPVVIGDETPDELDIADQDPQSVAQWLLTQQAALEYLRERYQLENVHAIYKRLTRRRDEYESIIREAAALPGVLPYSDVGYSMFDPPEWEEESDNLVFD